MYIYIYISNERLNKTEEITKKIDYNNLKLIAQSSGNETDSSEMEDTIVFLKNIKTVKITPKKAKDLKELFNKYLKKRRIE